MNEQENHPERFLYVSKPLEVDRSFERVKQVTIGSDTQRAYGSRTYNGNISNAPNAFQNLLNENGLNR